MTDVQIENFRRVLCMTLGPYALIMPKEEIIAIRDKMQAWANDPETIRKCEEENARDEAAEVASTPCSCDPKIYGATTDLSGIVICNKMQEKTLIRRHSYVV